MKEKKYVSCRDMDCERAAVGMRVFELLGFVGIWNVAVGIGIVGEWWLLLRVLFVCRYFITKSPRFSWYHGCIVHSQSSQ